MNCFFSGLFKEEIWIPKHRAEPLIRGAYHFLQAYQYLGHRSLLHGKTYFPMVPKYHMVQELLEELSFQCGKAGFCWNILCDACMQEEDFVGRTAFLTRCVSARNQTLRALQRYLAQVRVCWSCR